MFYQTDRIIFNVTVFTCRTTELLALGESLLTILERVHRLHPKLFVSRVVLFLDEHDTSSILRHLHQEEVVAIIAEMADSAPNISWLHCWVEEHIFVRAIGKA